MISPWASQIKPPKVHGFHRPDQKSFTIRHTKISRASWIDPRDWVHISTPLFNGVTIGPTLIALGSYQGIENFFIPKIPFARNQDCVEQNVQQNRDFITKWFLHPSYHNEITISLNTCSMESRFHCVFFPPRCKNEIVIQLLYLLAPPLTQGNQDSVV